MKRFVTPVLVSAALWIGSATGCAYDVSSGNGIASELDEGIPPTFYPSDTRARRRDMIELPPEAMGGEVISGDPHIYVRMDYSDGEISYGIFESTRGAGRVIFPSTEHATFLFGKVRITYVATGERVTLRAGDSYVIHQGTEVIWETVSARAQKSFFNITR